MKKFVLIVVAVVCGLVLLLLLKLILWRINITVYLLESAKKME